MKVAADGQVSGYPVEALLAMKWFRSNLRLGSRAALLALAIQFGLSFGHFHAGDGANVRSIVAALADADVRLERAASVTKPLPSSTSSNHQPAGQAGDDCAICAVMALAHAMLVVTPPDVVAPPDAHLLAARGEGAPSVIRAVAIAFQPRAPPAA